MSSILGGINVSKLGAVNVSLLGARSGGLDNIWYSAYNPTLGQYQTVKMRASDGEILGGVWQQ